MTFKEKKKRSVIQYVIFLLILVLLAMVAYIKLSPAFEQVKPTIKVKNNIFWNLKDKLKIKLSDNSGIKYYKIALDNGSKTIELDSKVLINPLRDIDLLINPPKLDLFFKSNKLTLTIEAFDNSKWNYLNGNYIKKTVDITIDNIMPIANVIDHSLAIRHGGSAVVVVNVKDKNLKDFYISLNNTIRFKLIPFYKKDYFVSLITWPVSIKEFNQVNLIAIDKAHNITKTKVPLYIRKLKVKKDIIKISDKFIKNVSSNVLELSGEDIPDNLVERFIKENKDLRDTNIKKIKDVTSRNMDTTIIKEYDIDIFKRLKHSRTAAGFAELRNYIHNNTKIDQQWHLGMDWASVKQASIVSSNKGKVIFNQYLGIYGNTVIIDHGMGLATLYAHMSSTLVQVGDIIFKDQRIGNTGSTGAVLGDHLHFGVLVQGIEVDPKEWMDRNWIRTRITKILDNAKKTIDLQ